MKNSVVVAFGLVMLGFSMSGCVMGEQRSREQAIAEGERVTLESETTVIDLLPDGVVASVDQPEEAVFLRCSKGHTWAGHVNVTLNRGIDGNGVLRALGRAAAHHGFQVRHDLMSSGSHRYALTSATGVYLLARVEEKGTVLHISSFSPCISLPDDSIPPERF